jgi:hypothetical protein
MLLMISVRHSVCVCECVCVCVCVCVLSADQNVVTLALVMNSRSSKVPFTV